MIETKEKELDERFDMKNWWRKLPFLARWVLVTLLIMILTTGGVYAYVALTATGEVTIEEALSFVGPNTFAVQLYPQQSTSANITIANASPMSLDVDLISLVTPDPGTKGLIITIPSKITVPASGQSIITINIAASKSVVPDIYNVSIQIVR